MTHGVAPATSCSNTSECAVARATAAPSAPWAVSEGMLAARGSLSQLAISGVAVTYFLPPVSYSSSFSCLGNGL